MYCRDGFSSLGLQGVVLCNRQGTVLDGVNGNVYNPASNAEIISYEDATMAEEPKVQYIQLQ